MADYRDLWKGLCCIWRHVPRGGYGFALRIPVQIVDIGTRYGLKVRIMDSGKVVTVKPESIILPPTMTGVKVTAEYDGSPMPARVDGLKRICDTCRHSYGHHDSDTPDPCVGCTDPIRVHWQKTRRNMPTPPAGKGE